MLLPYLSHPTAKLDPTVPDEETLYYPSETGLSGGDGVVLGASGQVTYLASERSGGSQYILEPTRRS